jgi:hypothetical protein
MKNITVSVDEETYRRARIAAAERNSSVSRLVRDYLNSLGAAEGGESDDVAALFDALDKATGFRASKRMSREEAHGRGHLP